MRYEVCYTGHKDSVIFSRKISFMTKIRMVLKHIMSSFIFLNT